MGCKYSDINICFSKFHSTFKSFYDECFPVSVTHTKIKHGKTKLWFTAGLKLSVHKKLYCKWLSPLSKIINNSIFYSGGVSLPLIAKVVPIFKSEDKLAVNNYRPVSVLPARKKS